MSEKQELNRIALRTPAVLAAVVVVLDLFAYMVGTGSPRDIATTVFVGLNLAFACMVGIWCATSQGRIRLIAAVLVLFLWGNLAFYCTDGSSQYWLIVSMIPVAIGAIVTATVEAIKFIFGQFEVIGPSNPEFREGLRFEISHLLILTTVIAVFVALVKANWTSLVDAFDTYVLLLKISTMVGICSANTLLSIWALLGHKINWRLPIAVLLQIGLCSLGGFIFDHIPIYFWALLIGLSILTILLHLFLLRRAGVRFVRHNR